MRAVIFRDDDILMVRLVNGECKLPGGGIEENESHGEALLREVAEETGYPACSIKQKIGIVTERYPDACIPDTYFEMVSHYYRCELGDAVQGPLRLSPQELEQNFAPIWMRLDSALRSNKEALLRHAANRWIHRENFVLAHLQMAAAK